MICIVFEVTHMYHDPPLLGGVRVVPGPQVHRLDFSAAGGASGEANNAAVLELTGLRPGSLIMAEWANSVSRPCHYLAVDHEKQRIVLSIRYGD